MIRFIKIPNELFYDDKDRWNKSLLHIIQDTKVLLILDFLYKKVDRENIITTSLENIIMKCGYKINARPKEINDQFKNILSKLQELNFIICDIDLKQIKPKELIECTLNSYNNGFVILYNTEKEKIMNYNKEKINNLQLLLHYCYLKSRIHKRESKKSMEKDHLRSEIGFPSYERITEDIGITDKTIKKYNDILVSLNLIRIANAGLWYNSSDKNKVVKESCNIYTLYNPDINQMQLELKEGIKYYKEKGIEEGKVFLGSDIKISSSNRKINGQLGVIEKKIKNNKATPEDIERKNEILESKNKSSSDLYNYDAYRKEYEFKVKRIGLFINSIPVLKRESMSRQKILNQ